MAEQRSTPEAGDAPENATSRNSKTPTSTEPDAGAGDDKSFKYIKPNTEPDSATSKAGGADTDTKLNTDTAADSKNTNTAPDADADADASADADADTDDDLSDDDGSSIVGEAGSRPVSQYSRNAEADVVSVCASEYNLNAYTADNGLSDADFFQKLAQGELLLCQEMQAWQEKYKSILGDLDNDVNKLLQHGIRLEEEGLSQEDLKVVKSRLRELDTMPIVKLVDYVHLCTFN
jgi:hypothetical protein